ncbi:MAG: hypothetical protein NTW09_04680 [Candidatus Omnitrophica bacterium]|nr:hypothetical protein [Candidatus Omnitrophota bacterium]
MNKYPTSKDDRNIRFEGNPDEKAKAIALVDIVLKGQGDLGVYGNLSGGVDSLIKEMRITITDKGAYYAVDMAPRSGQGHDFSFTIDKGTGRRSEVAIGEVLPPPK